MIAKHKYSALAETSFKNVLADVIAKNISADDKIYLNISHYKLHKKNFKERKKVIDLISHMCDVRSKCRYNPTKHYISTKSHVPPWILLRNISFSDSETLAKALMPDLKHQLSCHFGLLENISSENGVKQSILMSCVRTIRQHRNNIAHSLEFINYMHSSLDPMSNKALNNLLVHNDEHATLNCSVWAVVTAMIIILNNRALSIMFLEEIKMYLGSIKTLENMYITALRFPKDYHERLDSMANYLLSADAFVSVK